MALHAVGIVVARSIHPLFLLFLPLYAGVVLASLELLYPVKTIAVCKISHRCALINVFNTLNRTLLFSFSEKTVAGQLQIQQKYSTKKNYLFITTYMA